MRAQRSLYRDFRITMLGVIQLAISLVFIGRLSVILGVGYDCYCSDSVCFCNLGLIGVNFTSQLPINLQLRLNPSDSRRNRGPKSHEILRYIVCLFPNGQQKLLGCQNTLFY